MSIIVFENTAKAQSGKSNILRPDATGYYEIISGVFGVHNSSGAYYPFNQAVKNLFASSSDLMSRVSNGRLYGEWGHPKMDPGTTMRDFLLKLLIIHEEKVSHHIKKIELIEDFKDVNGNTCAAVKLWVKPYGPAGQYVEQMFANGEQDGCFSLRSISMDKQDATGKLIKTPVKIITWDAVLEPGIQYACKQYHPGTESKRYEFTNNDIIEAFELANTQGIGLESAKDDILKLANQLGITKFKPHIADNGKPNYLNW